MNGSFKDTRRLSSDIVSEVAQASLDQLRHGGWFSFSLSKMILAVACTSQHYDIAAYFVR